MPGKAREADQKASNDHDDVRDMLARSPDSLVRYWAAAYFVFLRDLLSREKAFAAALDSASTTGNPDMAITSARLHAEHTLLSLQALIADTLNEPLRNEWFGHRGNLQILQAIEDAMRSARLGQRHWLTKLDADEMPKTSQKEDPPRGIIEAKSAAILDMFVTEGGIEHIGRRIANVLVKSGFTHKREGPVTWQTVKEWRSKLKACGDDRLPNKRNKHFADKAERQYNIYCQAKRDLESLTIEQALRDLSDTCDRLVPRMLNARAFS